MITKNNDEISAVIVAAGSGRRMGGISKPEIVIRGKTLFARVLEVFSAMPEITRIIAVCSTENRARLETIAARAGIAAEFVPGGETRAESVCAGVCAAGDGLVCVHDCARPFIRQSDIRLLIAAARKAGASSACRAVTDTVKYFTPDGRTETPDRSRLAAVQTPQCFFKADYLKAREICGGEGFTDETALLEKAGYGVEYVRCGAENIKLTQESDIPLAEFIAEKFGY